MGVWPNVLVPGRESSGGGGGGGGGGASFYGVDLIPVDLTDGSWTLYDPQGLISSVSHADGYNLVTWNALSSGSQFYNWAAGTSHKAPRWYKNMQVEGNDIFINDLSVTITKLECDPTINDFNEQAVIGLANDPTDTNYGTIGGSGGIYSRRRNDNMSYGVWTRNSQVTTAGIDVTQGFAVTFRGGEHAGSGVYLSMRADGTTRNAGARNTNGPAAANFQQKVMVGVGTRGSSDTIAQDSQQRFKAWIRTINVAKGGY